MVNVMKNKSYSALCAAAILSVLSFNISADQNTADHYMMNGGEAHQGHNMSGNKHLPEMQERHNEIVQTGGHMKKEGRNYVMHGGKGNQGHWEGRETQPTNETKYTMSNGEL